MKKILISIFALAAISSTAFAQSAAPLEWKFGEDTKLKIGGFVRFNVNSDFGGNGVGSGNDFISTNIPSESDFTTEDYLGFDPSATRLSMELTQATEALGDVKVYIEGDFRGTGNTIRLRQAYVEANGFIAGQAWSFMSDLAANAPTIDINGVGSRTFLRTKLVGYRHNFNKGISAGIALEVPSSNADLIDEYTSVNQTVPNIPVYVQLKGKLGHIKLSAALNTIQYGDYDTAERVSETGWGAQASGSLRACDEITLYGQAIYGEGINTYISNLASTDVNLMSTDNKSMEATPMGGVSLGMGAKLSKKWSAALSGSVVKNYGDEEYFDEKFQRTGYLSAALFYAPAPKVTLGAEFLNGSRKNFGEDAASAQRLSFMVKYTL